MQKVDKKRIYKEEIKGVLNELESLGFWTGKSDWLFFFFFLIDSWID